MLEQGENWVKKSFNGNVAVYIGQKAVKGDLLGQFQDKIAFNCKIL